MARKAKVAPQAKVNERNLTKGQLRKLNALRNSLGQEIADKAFAEWLESRPAQEGASTDKNAGIIAEALYPLVVNKTLRIPRGGYLVTRGRGRIVVERAAQPAK